MEMLATGSPTTEEVNSPTLRGSHASPAMVMSTTPPAEGVIDASQLTGLPASASSSANMVTLDYYSPMSPSAGSGAMLHGYGNTSTGAIPYAIPASSSGFYPTSSTAFPSLGAQQLQPYGNTSTMTLGSSGLMYQSTQPLATAYSSPYQPNSPSMSALPPAAAATASHPMWMAPGQGPPTNTITVPHFIAPQCSSYTLPGGTPVTFLPPVVKKTDGRKKKKGVCC